MDELRSAYYYQTFQSPLGHNRSPIMSLPQQRPQTCWLFTPLFGLPQDTVICINYGADALTTTEQTSAASQQVIATESVQWVPTARPQHMSEFCRNPAGIHVFRWFTIRARHADKFVSLSTQAWQSFENDGQFEAQPEGLFRSPRQDQVADDPLIDMALVTRYRDFTSWERSRKPAPQASTNFSSRAQLTLRTWAYATRMVKP